jgi:hypothetical protein
MRSAPYAPCSPMNLPHRRSNPAIDRLEWAGHAGRLLRAEIRAGELLAEMAKRGERAKPGDEESGRGKKPLSVPTLAVLGVTKTQSGIRDPAHVAYPAAAKETIARRDSLLSASAALKRRLADAKGALDRALRRRGAD